MTERWSRSDVLLCIAALVWLACTMFVRPLALPDEGRYVSVAWEMLASGNWLYPTLNGLPFFHKPPLFYWITAASLKLFGVHDWSTRVAPLLGAMLAAVTLYGFALRQCGRRQARATLAVLATMPLFFASAQFATLDMLVAGCIAATTVLAAEAAIRAAAGQEYRPRLAAAYAAAAFGVLAKGLIGAVLPGLAIVAWLAWVRRPALLLRLLWLPGILLFAAIALPWMLAMEQRFPGFAHYFFVYHQFQRFAESGYNNPQPFWFYLPVLLIGTAPWSAWLLAAAVRRGDSSRGEGLSVRALMWSWAIAVTGFFSIPHSKTIGYILPALPPLAFLAAQRLLPVGEPAGLPRLLRWVTAGSAALCLATVVADTRIDRKSDAPLSKAIAAQRQAGEPVVFLKDDFFDAEVYLRLAKPAPIFEEWDRTDFLNRDDWRKALLDAAQFDPVAARQVLRDRREFEAALCGQPATWVFARMGAAAAEPALAGRPWIARRADRAVWKVTAEDLAARGLCRGRAPGAPQAGTQSPQG